MKYSPELQREIAAFIDELTPEQRRLYDIAQEEWEADWEAYEREYLRAAAKVRCPRHTRHQNSLPSHREARQCVFASRR